MRKLIYGQACEVCPQMRLLVKDPSRAAQLSAIFEQLGGRRFAELIVVRASQKGLYMQCVDAAKVCLFDGELTRDWFDEYDGPQTGGELRIGVVPRVMARVLSTLSGSQSIEMRTEGDGVDKLHVTLSGDPDQLDKFFQVQCVDADVDLLDLSNQPESQVDLVLPTKRMVELVAQLLIFDSVLRVDFGEEAISFESEGDEGSMKVAVELDDVTEYAIESPLRQQFSLSYLQTMCGFGKLAREIVMKFTDGNPMETRYDLGDASSVALYLAPKIEDD